MRILFSLIILLLFVAGCGDKKPSDVLAQNKMREVMWDMLQTGEFLDAYVLYKDTSLNKDKATTIKAWYDKIYQLHNVTRAQFEKSYTWYQDRPELMKEMLDTLSKRQLPVPAVADSAAVKKDTVAAKPSKVASKSDVLPPPTIKGTNMMDSLRRLRMLQRKQERLR